MLSLILHYMDEPEQETKIVKHTNQNTTLNQITIFSLVKNVELQNVSNSLKYV